MAISMAPLLVWSVVATLSVLVVLQLERTSAYNWAAIAAPLWFSDVCLLSHAAVVRADRCADRCSLPSRSSPQKAAYFAAICAKVTFEALLVVRLQYYANLSLFAVFAPLWLLLAAAIFNLGRRLISQFRLYNDKMV